MEDEATDGPYGCLWEVDVESDAESDGKHLDFDTMDWTNAPTAKQDYKERLAKAPHHCHGDSEPSGGTSSQDVAVLAHMDRIHRQRHAHFRIGIFGRHIGKTHG